MLNFQNEQKAGRRGLKAVVAAVALAICGFSAYTSLQAKQSSDEVLSVVKTMQEQSAARQQSAKAKQLEEMKAQQQAEQALPNNLLTPDDIKALMAAIDGTDWESCGVPADAAAKRRNHIRHKLEAGVPLKQADARFVDRSVKECEANKEKFKADQQAKEQDRLQAQQQLKAVFGEQAVVAPAAPKAPAAAKPAAK